MRPKTRAVSLAVLAALVAAAPAAAGNGGIAPVPPRSPNATSITDAYWLILAITGGVFVLVETALVVFVVRFRRKRRARTAEGPQIRGNTSLEITWTVVPVLILAAIVGFVFSKLPSIEDVPPASAGDRLAIRVEAQQYFWRFVYPGGQVAIDRMVVPAGRVVTLTVVSPDVAHSWWIPALGGKIDAIPGRTNHTWFRVKKPGTYRGQCAELCGLQHAVMLASVEVASEQAFQRFLATHSASSPALAKEAFEGVCAKCHGLQGQGDVGPRIAGSAILTDVTALTTLVRNGLPPTRTPSGMPAVGRDWSDAEIGALAAYLRGNPTLRGTQGGG